MVYNCETIHLAMAHRTLSKALMATQGYLTDDSYYHHAMEAIRIARSKLPEGHALLHPFLTNFGECHHAYKVFQCVYLRVCVHVCVCACMHVCVYVCL